MWLMVSRVVQGFGTSFTNVAVFKQIDHISTSDVSQHINFNTAEIFVQRPAMLSARYNNDQERGKALDHALSGVSVGLPIGPIFGGRLYHYFGKPVPFLILARLSLIDGCGQY
ncbi:hypothetical protein I4U23_010776 [Adineta vaga]|nr:hypothetical protein I4U23_010776 [Adineta vaga]